MALLFLRKLFLPKQSNEQYSPVRSKTPLMREVSRDRAIGMTENGTLSYASSQSDECEPRSRINPRIISDATIGLSDGLTVPFALTAGLSALGDTNVVIYGGFAELIAGGISMGLGGYLGAKSEAEGYQASLIETRAIVANDREKACSMVRSTFDNYDFEASALDSITNSLLASPNDMVDFIMKFHHQLAEADYAPSKAYMSGLTISLGYICGGLVALLPYLFFSTIQRGFAASVVLMAIALFAFGWIKTWLVGECDRWVCCKNGLQMLVLGGVAAGAAMGCVKAIE
ncbi:Hypothetical protein R9X50_00509100 [Acrodontium crateriforme]|uniref:DUF125-domain-containing protein n=1 Tax=Acrodontium crateriforme TaxID=150365 RepID=A0AAQ3RB92_9PEZI|nr:Hypothetical protein R9X50_00509100 [Acrodontium crateriforme]